MAFSLNLRSIILNRIIRSDVRFGFRAFSDAADGAAEGEEQDNAAAVDPTKDRTKVIPLETSMKYMQSKAYNQTYGESPVWFLYRRNHKGGFAPRKTRKSCVRNGMISTGNPCPICRDEYLVLHHQNTNLLEQFISEHTGQVLDAFKTGLCQKKHKELLVAIERAWDQGYLTYDVPFREYDYSLYNKNNETTKNKI
ncbi:28S ribosomal protein S18b, mitochondrial [Plutella xylostella]|uniref:28S ribosomal protein S18b, mitochondrial n=1 Tax=Plutella xylostella TaxID=51655 RepID=UPI002032AF83|nr:28S ribosomal protein S18b, mitochondrial [Plutella xylostella]